MKKLLLFNPGLGVERILREAERDAQFEVVAFVNPFGPAGTTLFDRPVVDLETARKRFERSDVEAFACGDSRFLNQDRLAAFMEAKRSGFRVTSIASTAASIGPGVRIRENVFIDADASVFSGANIGANTWLLGGVRIAENVRIGSSCWLADRCLIEREVVLGKNCSLAENVIVRQGTHLPSWTTINLARVIATSPQHAVFVDPLFRSEVMLSHDEKRID